jgi:hypothetical protein
VHVTPSFFDRIRGLVGAGPDRAAVPLGAVPSDVVLPPPPKPDTDDKDDARDTDRGDTGKKEGKDGKDDKDEKKGFWSKFKRIFTGGKGGGPG